MEVDKGLDIDERITWTLIYPGIPATKNKKGWKFGDVGMD